MSSAHTIGADPIKKKKKKDWNGSQPGFIVAHICLLSRIAKNIS